MTRIGDPFKLLPLHPIAWRRQRQFDRRMRRAASNGTITWMVAENMLDKGGLLRGAGRRVRDPRRPRTGQVDAGWPTRRARRLARRRSRAAPAGRRVIRQCRRTAASIADRTGRVKVAG